MHQNNFLFLSSSWRWNVFPGRVFLVWFCHAQLITPSYRDALQQVLAVYFYIAARYLGKLPSSNYFWFLSEVVNGEQQQRTDHKYPHSESPQWGLITGDYAFLFWNPGPVPDMPRFLPITPTIFGSLVGAITLREGTNLLRPSHSIGRKSIPHRLHVSIGTNALAGHAVYLFLRFCYKSDLYACTCFLTTIVILSTPPICLLFRNFCVCGFILW